MERSKRFLVVLGILLLTSCTCAVAGVFIGRIWERSVVDGYALNSVSQRIAAEHNWASVRSRIYCDMLVLGSQRIENEQQLALIGPYNSRKDLLHSYYSIYFDEYFTRLHVGDLHLIYDESDRLVEKVRWTGLGETLPITCP